MNALTARLSAQDPAALSQMGAGFALFAAVTDSRGYNLPVLLFGILALEMHGSTKPLKAFISILLPSFLLDFLTFPSYSILSLIFALILIAIKIPLYFSSVAVLTARGDEVKWGMPDPRRVWRSGAENVNGAGAGGGSSTIFQMPGSFTNAPGPPSTITNNPPPRFPSSGGNVLGTDESAERGQGHVPPGIVPGRGGYSVLP